MTIPHWLTSTTEEIESVSRTQAQSIYFGDNTVVCRVLGKYLVYADTADVGITPHLALNGYWESWITLTMARLVQPGWHCLDLGANHGYYTVIMADGVGPTGAVVAVEPNPDPARRLRRTLDVNAFSGFTTLVEKAASDAGGQMLELSIEEHRGLNATLHRREGFPTVSVESVTVDELAADWPRVDLIKIDVEGAEEAVWRGMGATLEQNPDVTIVVEVNTTRIADASAYFGEIEAAGFRLRYIDFDGEIKETTVDRLTKERRGEDWMLFLQRTIDV
jgi:FkbM family methyltransferase